MSYVSLLSSCVLDDAHLLLKFHFVQWSRQLYVLIFFVCRKSHPLDSGSLQRSFRTCVPNHHFGARFLVHLCRHHHPANVQDRPRSAHFARSTVDTTPPSRAHSHREACDDRPPPRRRREGFRRLERTRDRCPPRFFWHHWKHHARAECPTT